MVATVTAAVATAKAVELKERAEDATGMEEVGMGRPAVVATATATAVEAKARAEHATGMEEVGMRRGTWRPSSSMPCPTALRHRRCRVPPRPSASLALLETSDLH